MSEHEEDKRKDHSDQEGGVIVLVDTKKREVKGGEYVVSDFKTIVHVAAEKALEEKIDGRFVLLADDSKLTIKGGEEFISHVRRGGSSCE